MADDEIMQRVLTAQRNEITEYHIYRRLAARVKDPHNRGVLDQISLDELRHHDIWQSYTGQKVEPDRFKVWLYVTIGRILGISFSIKRMENGEQGAQENYNELASHIPAALAISSDENSHEEKLIQMIDEDRFKYVGAVIRGLNEAVVELTAILTGLTLVIEESPFVAAAGVITGFAMSLSLGSTEYLATKAEEGHQQPFKSALYTGLATLITVGFLIFPYLVLHNNLAALGVMLAMAIVIIFFFNYYISVALNRPLWRRFGEMSVIAMAIAGFTYLVGWLAQNVWHIEMH